MRSMRKAVLAAVTAGVLVSTAACGSDSSSEADAKGENGKSDSSGTDGIFSALRTSQEKSHEASTVSFTSTMSMSVADESTGEEFGFSYAVEGTTGWDPLVMDLTMDMTEYMEAFQELLGGEAEETPEMVFDLRFVDNVMYMGGPLLAAEPEMDGKSWVKIDIDEMAAATGESEIASQLRQAENMAQSPAEQIELLLESPDVTHQGTEEFEGQQTEVYAGELTLDELLAADSSSEYMSEESLDELRGQMEALEADAFNLTVWIGEDELPVRVDMDMEMAEGEVTYSTVYRDYGAALAVEAPDAADVLDIAEAEDGGLLGIGGGTDGEDALGDYDLEDMDNWTEEDWAEFEAEMEAAENG